MDWEGGVLSRCKSRAASTTNRRHAQRPLTFCAGVSCSWLDRSRAMPSEIATSTAFILDPGLMCCTPLVCKSYMHGEKRRGTMKAWTRWWKRGKGSDRTASTRPCSMVFSDAADPAPSNAGSTKRQLTSHTAWVDIMDAGEEEAPGELTVSVSAPTARSTVATTLSYKWLPLVVGLTWQFSASWKISK